MNNYLSDKDLELVSGGMNAGKIGPKDPTIVDVRNKIENAKLALSHFSVQVPELVLKLDLALNSLKKGTGFNPWNALIRLQEALPLSQQLLNKAIDPADKTRASEIIRFLDKARFALDVLLD